MRYRWFEEYACGCVSEPAVTRHELLGYCSKHGDERRNVYKETDKLVVPVLRVTP